MSEEIESVGYIKLDLTELSVKPPIKRWIKFFAKPIKILTKITTFEMYLNDIDQDTTVGTIWEKWLKHLQIFCKPRSGSVKNIPKSGGVIFIANHPLGFLDCVALMAVLKPVRADVKILANPSLQALTGLTDDIIEKTDTEDWLKNGGALLVFPCEQVSVVDNAWNPWFGEIILTAQAPVLPIFFHEKNTKLFYYLTQFNPKFSSLLSPRECLKKRGGTIYYSIGKLITANNFQNLSVTDVVKLVREKYQLNFQTQLPLRFMV